MANPNPSPATRFKPNQSGNPGGRPKQLAALRELARQHTDEAIEGLIGVARDPKQPGSTRVAAWREILDRGWGRPIQEHQVHAMVEQTEKEETPIRQYLDYDAIRKARAKSRAKEPA